ncbi:MAG TPA: isoprenylcysteine carboxylmethyltransferase family protein [Noviherbaspirillum sp.]|nr:isoprenylcysteine carboxylmethyltransferase family protein [Noviherbaspirillum sp.]
MGKRGESWVAAQAILFIAFITVPQVAGPWPYDAVFLFTGWVLFVLGLVLTLWSARALGRSLTPFPRPLEHAELVTTGPYRLVRHPIYLGVLLVALGISLVTASPLRLGLTLILFVFFDRKAAREERWLEEKFPQYPAYRSRVKRLIPWVY